jgi:hypothetical protein
MMTNKLPDWHNRLVEYIGEYNRTSFDDTRHHCGYFTGNAYFEMTGEDIMADLRDAGTLREMMARIVGMGFADHVEFLASKLEETTPGLADPGDLAVLPGLSGWSLGVIQGDYVYAVADQGIVMVPRANVTRAFKV